MLDFAQWKANYTPVEADPHIPVRNPSHYADGASGNASGRFKCCPQPDLLAYLELRERHRVSINAFVPNVQ